METYFKMKLIESIIGYVLLGLGILSVVIYSIYNAILNYKLKEINKKK